MATDIFDREHRFALEDLYSGEGKSRVESEVILPDYKEAAQRILRVDCKSRVNSKNIYPGSNQLICEVEGVCNLYLLYFSELKGDHGIPCSFSVQEPFSYTFKIPTKGESRSPEELAAILEIRTENLSHMLLGPRKIAIRSDLSLTLNIKHNAPFDYYSDTFPKDICTKTVPISAARLLETYSEEMNFSETISLPKASLAIGEISEMEVELFAHRIIPTEGGIRLQGSCDVHCNYTAQDEESFVSFYQPIDFERNLGIASCSQSSFCEVFLTPNFMKATTDINEEGENKNILFEIGCTAEVFVFENQRFDVATDLFSTESFLETERAEISLEEIALKNEFCIPYKNSVSFREKGIVRAEAIRCRADFQNAYQEGEGISIEGKLFYRFLGVKESGEILHCEDSCDFKANLKADFGKKDEVFEDFRIEINGGVRGFDLDPREDQLDLRCELCGQMTLFLRRKERLISSVSRGEKKLKDRSSLIFYYPEKGEDVWSVSKKFSVSPQKLCRENGIAEDKLPRVIRMMPWKDE